MTPTTGPLLYVAVALAGALGAVLRHLLTSHDDVVVAANRTAVVNVAGAAALGAATVLLSPATLLVVGGGLLGALTTFSAWMVHVRDHPRHVAVAVVPLALGIAAAVGGRLLAEGLA